MIINEELIFSYILNFISLITLFYCFRWSRDYVPLTITIAVCSVLALSLEIKELAYPFILEVFFSIFISMLLAMPLSLAIEFLPFSGRFFDVLRGMQFAEISFGQNNSRGSILENMSGLLIASLFFKYDMFLILFKKLNQSKFSSGFDNDIVLNFIKSSSNAFIYGIQISFPVLVVCFSIDLMALLLSKVLPKVNLMIDFNSSKALVGLLFVYLGFEFNWLQIKRFLLLGVN